ncbi:phosphoribosylformylglycinamidine synthase [Mesobacillus boroniphilus JCM 21738]|uniref:Phosphoribosylformylglycinamidine synthase n=1 Tax=Mesobacillus boroniphilus JCM 21738 TaxID=1294265 RepID=W4RR44_9BACI|nr:phosphoribosylformylglycinamidine synthase [Mesobacillus boroniphilus JCM 21738]
MVGLVENLKHVTTQHFKNAGDLIYLLGDTKDEFGGSELQKLMYGRIFGKAPVLNLEVEAGYQAQILTAIKNGLVASAHDVAEGGVAVALAESVIGSKGLGAEVTLEGNAVSALFSESQSRFILSVKPENQIDFESLTDAVLIGKVVEAPALKIDVNGENVINQDAEGLKKAWKGAIPCLLN